MEKKLVLIGLLVLIVSCDSYTTLETFDNGNVKLKCETKNGLNHGDCIAYFETGEIRYVSKNTNGTLDGLTTYYHRNGLKHWEVNFKTGVKEGKVDYYDSIGRIYQTSEFRNSLLDGTSYEFYLDGSVKTKADYSKGELNGQLLRYSTDGNVLYNSNYSLGLLKDYQEYDMEGNLIDQLLKYRITHTLGDKNEVIVSIDLLNPMYPVMMVEFYDFESVHTEESSPKVIETLFSEEQNVQFKFKVHQGEQTSRISGIIYDMEPVNDGEEIVVRNGVQFSYEFELSQ